MKFSEAKGRKVVAVATADTVGRLRGFLVDPATRSVVALRVKKTDQGDVLRWEDLIAFGVDAVTIEDSTAIVELDGELKALRKRRRLLKKRVLTTGGDELGNVADVEFDPDTGGLTNIMLHEDAEVISADRLVGIGSYAVVVREQPDTE